MLHWITAGESHGPELVAVIEGMPAQLPLRIERVREELARRRLGFGRGSRMKFEQDEVAFSSGVVQGKTIGSPIALRIQNTEWPKWSEVMSAEPVEMGERSRGRGAPLLRPRPGHADLVGMQKYGFEHARPVLERASARETAARVALGAVAKTFLEALGIHVFSHTVSLGTVAARPNGPLPRPEHLPQIDTDPLRCFDPAASEAMVELVQQTKKRGDTLGGVVEVLAYGVPYGLGSYVHWDRRLDAKLAAALMSIQAIKGVEVGDGFTTATRPGSQAHDPLRAENGTIVRDTGRAGGIEGGMSTGQIIRVRAAMKPIATVPKALPTVDVSTGEPAKAHHQRSDVCAVPAAGVVAESMVALTLAQCVLEKFGGDSLSEVQRNMRSFLETTPANLHTEIER